MTRVLHVLETLRRGGLERVVVAVANGLQQRGLPQAVCCLNQPGPLADALDPAVEQFALQARPNQASLPFAIAGVIRHFRPDIIQMVDFAGWPDTTAAAIMHPRIRRLRTFHGFLEEPPLRYRLTGWALARFTHQLLAVSPDLADRAAQAYGIDRRRLHLCPNGVDTGCFDPHRVSAQRAELGLPSDAFVCVTTATLSPVKNPLVLIPVSRQLGPGVKFLWVGEGPLRQTIEQEINRAGLGHSIKLVGAVDDVRPYLAAADAFILPSLSEALPLSVLEAMAMHLPVIATRTGMLETVVAQSGSGLVVQPNAAAELAQAIQHLQTDSAHRTRMSACARQTVLTHYSLSSMLDRYQHIFEALHRGTASAPLLAPTLGGAA